MRIYSFRFFDQNFDLTVSTNISIFTKILTIILIFDIIFGFDKEKSISYHDFAVFNQNLDH